MFLHHLNDRQASVFLFLAERVVAADGKIKYQELAKVSSFLRQLNPDIMPTECPLEEAGAVFDSKLSKISALLELISLAFSDDDYAPSEDNLIDRLGCSFDISPEAMAKMKDWCARQMVLTREAEALLKE